MPGSSFGRAFRVTTFGESHGGAVGVVIEGCPPDLELDMERVQAALSRRRPGQSNLTTSRGEADQVEVLSGVFEGKTLGTPLALMVRNHDADPSAYRDWKDTYRPSHADFTYEKKYGHRAWAGGGRASARETLARVAAGAVAEQVLETLGAVEVVAWVDRVHVHEATVDSEKVSRNEVEASKVRSPDPRASGVMIDAIREAAKAGDTLGGMIRCVVRGVPAGLGEPVFDKLEADLAKALMSLPSAKGFEVGSGYAGARLKGSEHNDPFIQTEQGETKTSSNRSGGIQGGISNGMPIEVSVAFKPVSTLGRSQETVNQAGEATQVNPRGRHDPCVLPRAVPIVEAMVSLVLVDHWLRWRGQTGRS